MRTNLHLIKNINEEKNIKMKEYKNGNRNKNKVESNK
jgi:hypothetical protein